MYSHPSSTPTSRVTQLQMPIYSLNFGNGLIVFSISILAHLLSLLAFIEGSVFFIGLFHR